MHAATCTHTITNPCKHNKKCKDKCKKRPQTKSCHYSNNNTCKTCSYKEECDLIIPMPKHTKIHKLYTKRKELLHDLRLLREDKKEYYKIKTQLEHEGNDKKVEDIIHCNIQQTESEIMEKEQELRIIENGPYKKGRYDKTQSYNSLITLARKQAIRNINHS